MKIISRKQAIAESLKKYFTGKTCKNGHLAERWTDSHSCIECQKKYSLNYLKNNPESFLFKKDPEENRRRSQEWRNKNEKKAKKVAKIGQSKYRKTKSGRLRSICNNTITRLSKGLLTNKFNLLDYSADEFLLHILNPTKFSNLEEAYKLDYHIDHIVPISYIAKNVEDKVLAFRVAMDLQNLKLTKDKNNLSKSDKINSKEVQDKILYLWDKYSL